MDSPGSCTGSLISLNLIMEENLRIKNRKHVCPILDSAGMKVREGSLVHQNNNLTLLRLMLQCLS